MKRLLSLPPHVVECFHNVTGLSTDSYFCTSDPVGHRLGSGGGTIWLLEALRRAEAPETPFSEWLPRERRILLHAAGQSRRLPAYAPGGKVLTPVPVFRWERGQRISQTLLDLQMPLFEHVMQQAPQSLRTLVASGDVYLRCDAPLEPIPEADVVCFGLWGDAEQASHHGVFMIDRNAPTALDFMLQKPSTEVQAALMPTHFALMDIGLWLLSDRAVEVLARRCTTADAATTEATDEALATDRFTAYDLYSQLGCALGRHPSAPDEEAGRLSVAIVPFEGGEFYHFGTTEEMIASAWAIQNRVKDQRFIIQKRVKRHSAVFTQNVVAQHRPDASLNRIWLENCRLGDGWTLHARHVLTGIPTDSWTIDLPEGVCVDVVPVDEAAYALRPYGFTDAFRGDVTAPTTHFLERPVTEWLAARGISADELVHTDDLQRACLFPISTDTGVLERLLRWFITDEPDAADTALWRSLPRYSADMLTDRANLRRLFAQRHDLCLQTLPTLARNWPKSVFYQVNLKDMARHFSEGRLPMPDALPDDAPVMTRIHDAMFRSEVLRPTDAEAALHHEQRAFAMLSDVLTAEAGLRPCHPKMTTLPDQIVWGRSAVRIDLAGGWTDTPPYTLLAGGNVVNMAIELNGHQPLQVYIKPSREKAIICRSIDLSAMERITTYEALADFAKVGSPFSIPKAALALAGFLPRYAGERHASLERQLEAFGCGIEITLLSAIPAGSGLGTSSILAATVLGAVADFCGLGWDKTEICRRTLMLEQLLTTGGGWQDQYGGVLHGVKLLQSQPGLSPVATPRWLPDTLFTDPEIKPCHLLYYTGLTRTAKHILAEIVRGMFLNSTEHLDLLNSMKQHAMQMYEAIQLGRFDAYGRLLRRTWEQNQALDSGTNPPVIEALCRRIDDYCLGYKLPGAGGGGFLYMVAKDPMAALRIREELTARPAAPGARFVEMSLSKTGLQVSRS